MSGGWPQALDAQYTLLHPLSDGEAARVFAAHDRKHARDVAIKVLRLDATDAGIATRFLQEVRIAAQLSHPHILPLFDSGEVEGAPYFVMPLVDGMSLRRRLEEDGPLPIPVALSIARQVAAALEHAHARGVVHRDIKPANILLDGREAMVTDFGVAAALSTPLDDRITLTGMVVGTPRYMSPEQAAGDPTLDGRADIYALGVVLFEMLTGEAPYSSVFTAAAWNPDGAPPSARARRPEVPVEVDAAIAAAIARDPQQRMPSARAFIDALASPSLSATTPVEGTSTAVGARASWRRPAALLGAFLIVMALGAVLVTTNTPFARTANDPSGRRWVLVAEFDAEPQDRANALAMRELAITELAQSPDFSIVPSDHVVTARRNAGIADTIAMSGSIARELAMRSAVRVVVEGAIRRMGDDRWSLTMRAVNASDGSVLFAASGDATNASLVREVGRVVRRVRSGLGERPDALEATRPLQEVSTASFPAFLRLQEALARTRAADYDGAIHLLHQALALDSGFAAAWSLLATTYVSVQRTDSAAWAFAHALALPERLSDADRDRLSGDVAFYVDSDPERAVRDYDAYLVRRPESLGAHNNRGLFLSALGRHRDALDGFRAAMRVDPLQVGPRNIQMLNIATELIVLGHLDSAEVAARPLRGAHAQYALLLRLNAAGQWDSLARAAREVLEAPSPARFAAFPAMMHEIGALEALGRHAEANALFAGALARARGSDARWLSHARLLLDAARGERPAWPLPSSVQSDSGGASCLVRGLYAAQRSEVRRAADAAECLRVLSPRERRTLGWGPEYLDAWRAMAEGDAERAARILREPAARGEHHPFSVDRVSSIALRLLEAQALARVGRLDEADRALTAAKSAVRLPPSHYPLRGLAARAVVRPTSPPSVATSGGM